MASILLKRKSQPLKFKIDDHCQWRIQDFPQGGAPTPKSAIIFQFFAENCMKMKEFGPPGGGRASLAPPLGSANDCNPFLVTKR